MRQIYQQAANVLVWPSIEVEDGQDQLAELVNGLPGSAWEATQTIFKPHCKHIISRLQDTNFNSAWEALANIHTSSYWNRVWIVQEVLSNRETWVYFGKQICPLLPLLSLGLAIQYLDDNEIALLPQFSKALVERVSIPACTYKLLMECLHPPKALNTKQEYSTHSRPTAQSKTALLGT